MVYYCVGMMMNFVYLTSHPIGFLAGIGARQPICGIPVIQHTIW